MAEWLVEDGIWADAGLWDDGDVWQDSGGPLINTGGLWLLSLGLWRDNGFWRDDDVWQDGPPVLHTRTLIMLEGPLRPVSNKATWTDRIELYDTETGDGINLEEGVDSITLSLRDPWSGDTIFEGDLDDGTIVVIPQGIIEWSIPPDTMQGIEPKSYEVGCLIEMEDETIQIMLGHVSVRKGL